VTERLGEKAKPSRFLTEMTANTEGSYHWTRQNASSHALPLLTAVERQNLALSVYKGARLQPTNCQAKIQPDADQHKKQKTSMII